MMKKYLEYTLWCLLLLSATGCTKENLDNCDTGIRLSYYYTLNKHNANLFGEEIHDVYVFVFDANGQYYKTFYFDDAHDLSNNNSLWLPLPVGNYKIVSWCGDLSSYIAGTLDEVEGGVPVYHDGLVVGQTTLEEFRMLINYDEDLSPDEIAVTKTPGNLYFGDYKEKESKPATDATSGATIGLTKNTNTIILKISGANHIIPPTPLLMSRAANGVEIYANIRNGRYKYDNSIGEYARNIKYLQPWEVDSEGYLEISFTVMRILETDNEAKLVIESPLVSGGKIEIPIVQTILDNPAYNNQQDLDREDEYIFELSFSADLYMTITINDWEIINITPNK